MTDEAAAYLDDAFWFVAENSVMRDRVDWLALRREVFELAGEAQSTADTYPAIRLILRALGDRHSHLVEPDVVRQRSQATGVGSGLTHVAHPEGVVALVAPDSAAERAGIRAGDVVEAVNGEPSATLSADAFFAALRAPTVDLRLRRAGEAGSVTITFRAEPFSSRLLPEGRRLGRDVGYLSLPELVSGANLGQEYAVAAHRIIRDVDEAGAHGWVIDLRRNRGGDLWPMIAAVGPLLGDEPWDAFVSSQAKNTITYRDGQVWDTTVPFDVDRPTERRPRAQVASPYRPGHAPPAAAVLTSRFTGSSAEHVALAFRGLSRTRSFGEPTAGTPTGNQRLELADGAALLLTVCLGGDRSGRTYDGPIEPDESVATDWGQLGTERDPVVRAALAWLDDQAPP
jgi:C-terminal processing protease CtpA/Prc